ncbi:MAG TPA: MMPL family transporter, partial [Acidimicrobiia bacterium]|nr:MMPL family transporter [Acidimicrobiia bacterium]
IVSALAASARRLPWAVVIVTFALTAILGSFAGQVEIASGNEGFAPESAEIAAQERIPEKFGDEGIGSTVQVIIRAQGDDVITLEGLETAMATTQAIRRSEVGEVLIESEQQPGVVHYLSGVEQAMVADGLTLEEMTDDMVKQFYSASLDPVGTSPEQASFLTRLVSEDFDNSGVSASGGMVLAFVGTYPGDDAEESFNNQVETEGLLADDLAVVDSDLEIRPFSFGLLLTGVDDFTTEVGQLFALAFVVILVILGFVYWLSPGKEGSWFASARRTLTDMLVTLLTIVMAIGIMQGAGYLLEQIGVIDAFSAPTQIVPILMIGLGVDYAIHLTSRYREEVGQGKSVDRAMTGAVTSVGIALFLATITTVIGFLTNVFNPVPALKDFGILAAVGIVVAFLLMLTFVPAIRMLLDRRAERNGTLPVRSLQAHGDRLLPRFMEKLAVLARHAAVPTLVVAGLFGAAGFYGFTQLETRFSFTDFLPEDSEYVETLELLADDFGGGFGEQTQVLVEATDEQPIDGEVHNALVAANEDIAAIGDVSVISTAQGDFPDATSPIGILGQLLSGEPAPPEVLAAAQEVGLGADLTVSPDADVTPLYEAILASAPEQAAGVIAMDGGAVDGLLWDITTTAGEDVSDLRFDLDTAFEPVRDLEAFAIVTSDNVIGDVVVNELTASQSSSLFLTVGVAALVLMVSFYLESRRWFLGVLTIAPVALVVLWTYGLMFATGIPFGPVTATIAALSIGIGVPFTIHIARRFQEDRRANQDGDVAMRSTMRHTGGALAGSAFTTMAGFGTLITSSLIPFRQMGQVTVYAIGLSLLAAVLVLPSMLALWDRWHRKRGDRLIGSEALGEAPSH